MKRLVKTGFLSLLVLAVATAVGVAQQMKQGGQRGDFGQRSFKIGPGVRGGGPAELLRQDVIQKELKVTDPQKKKITAAFAKLNRGVEGILEMSREERLAAFRNIGALSKKAGQTAIAVLTKEQKERLYQLDVQQSGPRVLQQGDMQKKLGFSAKQTRKVKSLVESLQKNQREVQQKLRNEGSSFSAMREKMQEMRNKLNKAVLGVLTKEQAKQFQRMKGKNFDFMQHARGF